MKRAPTRTLVRSVAVVALIWGSAARAAQKNAPPPVQLSALPCVPVPVPLIRDLLTLELSGTTVAPSERGEAATRVELSCPQGIEAVEITVRDPLTNKVLVRSVTLSGVRENARARLLALAIAELVSASWMELEARPRTPDAAPPPRPLPPADVVAGARAVVRSRLADPIERRLRLGPLLSVRRVDSEVSLLGGGVRLLGAAGPRFGFGVDAVYETGQRSFSLGRVDLDALSMAAVLKTQHHVGSAFLLTAGAGARGGATWIRGTGADLDVAPTRFTAPWGGPLVEASGTVVLRPQIAVEMCVELGYALISASGRVSDRTRVDPDAGTLGLTGLWVGISLSLGYGT